MNRTTRVPPPSGCGTLSLALVALAAAACGSPAPPPRKATAPLPVAIKPVTEEETVPKVPTDIYVYSPIGKRDPFQNVFQGASAARVQSTGRAKTALEKWPLDALKLALTVTGTASPLAMVEDPDHRGWPVHLGDFIGQNQGKVTGIHRDEIVVTETITDHATGRVYPQNVKLTVPVSKDEERDIKALQEGEHLGVAKGE
jgi:type IV pilus assembly protein PilP